MTNTQRDLPQLSSLHITIQVIQGRNLVAKDRHSVLAKKTTSDPFVTVVLGGKSYGRTTTKRKTLNPKWDASISIRLGSNDANRLVRLSGTSADRQIELRISDEDQISSDDPMGVVLIPLPLFEPPETEPRWHKVQTGPPRSSYFCKNASGELEVRVTVAAKPVLRVVRGNVLPIPSSSFLRVGLGWDVEAGVMVDLDASCVAVDRSGNVLMDDTVYYGNLSNTNRSVTHSGDEREGDEDLGGSGDDEIITVDVGRVPSSVLAMYFLVTIATPDRKLCDVKSALVRVTDLRGGGGGSRPLCNFAPSLAGRDHTAMFLMRLARGGGGGGGGGGRVGGTSSNGPDWTLSTIEDTDASARDFGSLIPEIKGYTRDLVPGIHIDPRERIAVMRKGGTIRLRDYAPPTQAPTHVTLGLAWDVTNGVNIDLDASAICLDSSYGLVDVVYFKHLTSKDGSIRHGGDEREGDEVGDDEKIFVDLSSVDRSVRYIGFVLNSYSGQELDDVARASCHLFDSRTGKDLARYALTNCRELDKHTALVMACLYREEEEYEGGGGYCGGGTWLLRIISEAAHGRVAQQLVDELQAFLMSHPAQAPSSPPEPEIVLTAMPAQVPIDEEIVVNASPVPVFQLANPQVGGRYA